MYNMEIMNRKLDTNTTIILVTTLVAITVAYMFGPAEHRSDIIATAGGFGTLLAALGRQLLAPKDGE